MSCGIFPGDRTSVRYVQLVWWFESQVPKSPRFADTVWFWKTVKVQVMLSWAVFLGLGLVIDYHTVGDEG